MINLEEFGIKDSNGIYNINSKNNISASCYDKLYFSKNENYIMFSKNNIVIHKETGVTGLFVNKPHVVKSFNPTSCKFEFTDFCDISRKYIYYDSVYLHFDCVEPIPDLDYLFPKKLSYVAEIGTKFGATTRFFYNKFKGSIKTYDCYEKNLFYATFLEKTLGDTTGINIYFGNAAKMLRSSVTNYDFVLFDASHEYEEDEKILQTLITRLTNDSIIIFNAYENPEVEMLIEDYLDRIPGHVYSRCCEPDRQYTEIKRHK